MRGRAATCRAMESHRRGDSHSRSHSHCRRHHPSVLLSFAIVLVLAIDVADTFIGCHRSPSSLRRRGWQGLLLIVCDDGDLATKMITATTIHDISRSRLQRGHRVLLTRSCRELARPNTSCCMCRHVEACRVALVVAIVVAIAIVIVVANLYRPELNPCMPLFCRCRCHRSPSWSSSPIGWRHRSRAILCCGMLCRRVIGWRCRSRAIGRHRSRAMSCHGEPSS